MPWWLFCVLLAHVDAVVVVLFVCVCACVRACVCVSGVYFGCSWIFFAVPPGLANRGQVDKTGSVFGVKRLGRKHHVNPSNQTDADRPEGRIPGLADSALD